MSTITPPELDPHDLEVTVAQAVDDLPPELSDRNASSPAVTLIEAVGAIYALILYYLGRWREAVEIVILELLDITQTPASPSRVTLTFVASAAGATIPSGTRVRSGYGIDAVEFETTAALELGASASGDVEAVALEAGASGDVSAGLLRFLSSPLPGVASVTNAAGATGGADAETLAAMRARAPLEQRSRQRAVTDEDFAYHAGNDADVVRARALGSSGAVAVHLITDDANAAYFADSGDVAQETIRERVREDLEARTIPGLGVGVYQAAIRWVRLANVHVELTPGYDNATVRDAIEAVFLDFVRLTDRTDTDGVTVLSPAWRWGRSLYVNELISRFDAVDGVERVELIVAYTSDNYGNTWSGPLSFNFIEAGWGGVGSDTLGMLQGVSALDHGGTLTLTEL